jgi:hypothetical protein
VSSALLSGKGFKFSFTVSDVTEMDSTLSIDVNGLGIGIGQNTVNTDILDSDWYLGPYTGQETPPSPTIHSSSSKTYEQDVELSLTARTT